MMNKVTILSLFVGMLILNGCKKAEIALINEIKYSSYKDMRLDCPVESINGSKKSIVGKWKLVREYGGLRMEGPLNEDYSCNMIVYHFRSNGKVEINSDIEYYNSGVHPYALNTSPPDDKYFYERFGLSWMGYSSETPCDIIDNGRVLVLNSTYLDGTIRFFVRIK